VLPKVILHNAVSVDGRTVGFAANLGLFYRLAGQWHEDLTLAGSDTVLAALRQSTEEVPADLAAEAPDAEGSGGVLAVVDSRGRIKNWRTVKTWPLWHKHVSIGCDSTPSQHEAYLRYQEVDSLTAGEKSVDLKLALEELNRRYGASVIRVESGGLLNGALLAQGLVDEVSILIHPVLVGGMGPRTIYRTLFPRDPVIDLRLIDCQRLDDAYVWLRYQVVKDPPAR
jgi:2,5-diamino-6-(ribosylamino)-4(3H)-pyrimidinone 5'-phosphate reductase